MEKVLNVLKKNTMLIALILVIIVFFIGTGGKIMYPQNLNNLLSQNAYVFVLATGMLLCILTGGNIDLSVGSVIAFVGGIGAVMMDKGVNVVLTVIVMLIIGTAIGWFQGFWIAEFKVPPFIATLAGMYAFRGLANVVLQGYTVAVNSDAFLVVFGGGADCYVPDILGSNPNFNLFCMVIGVISVIAYLAVTFIGRISKKKKGYITEPLIKQIAVSLVISAVIIWLSYKLAQYKGIPTSLIWILVVVFAYAYVTSKTTIGRYLYAVGGNEKATRLSGINTKTVYLFAYINMGFLAALSAILVIARATNAQPTFGQGYEMDAIGACFIGGASAYGGIGKVSGVIIGAILMGVINQGMSIMGIDANYQKVVKGLVLLIAIIFDIMSKKQKK